MGEDKEVLSDGGTTITWDYHHSNELETFPMRMVTR